MNRFVRAGLAGLVAFTVVAASVFLAPASPASAWGEETFGCRISPGSDLTWRSTCYNNKPASTYNVGFAVLNTSGTYTYSWNISGPYLYVITGCTSTSSGCAVAVPNGDAAIVGTVTYSQNGQSATRQAVGIVRAYCGKVLC